MYHVYVDGFLKTTVRASDKTRALVEGVDSTKVMKIILNTLYQMSSIAASSYQCPLSDDQQENLPWRSLHHDHWQGRPPGSLLCQGLHHHLHLGHHLLAAEQLKLPAHGKALIPENMVTITLVCIYWPQLWSQRIKSKIDQGGKLEIRFLIAFLENWINKIENMINRYDYITGLCQWSWSTSCQTRSVSTHNHRSYKIFLW